MSMLTGFPDIDLAATDAPITSSPRQGPPPPLDVTRSISGLEVLVKLAGGHLLADGNLVLSPEQARTIARRLINVASEAELAARLALEHAGPSGAKNQQRKGE